MKEYLIAPAAELDQKIKDSGVGEDEIALNNMEYKTLFGAGLKESGARPPSRGVVRISMKTSGESHRVYRKYRGAIGIKGNEAVVSWTTLNEILCKTNRPEDGLGLAITVEPLVSWHGRALFYWHHPDDAARVSFKLGMIGIVLGLLSLMFDWKDIRDFFSCLIGT